MLGGNLGLSLSPCCLGLELLSVRRLSHCRPDRLSEIFTQTLLGLIFFYHS